MKHQVLAVPQPTIHRQEVRHQQIGVEKDVEVDKKSLTNLPSLAINLRKCQSVSIKFISRQKDFSSNVKFCD